MMKTICTRKEHDGYAAWLKANPGVRVKGSNKAEAVGLLVIGESNGRLGEIVVEDA